MKKIIIASDSFKGSLTSMEVAIAAKKGIRNVFPQCSITKVNVADGGEGTVETIVKALNGRIHTVSVADPLGRPVNASYGVFESNGLKTAVIEMSSASGLPLLLPEERNPCITSTFGTGELILNALNQGCRKFLIGIGGSATNDAGTGMLTVLGVKFFDASGNQLKGCGNNLKHIAQVDMSGLLPEIQASEFIVACDVDTPFCGPGGSAYIYAPQKGATLRMVEALDEGMISFARVVADKFGTDITYMKGAGAAGGLGGTLKAFLNARLTEGIEMVLDVLSFDSIIQNADLVITGEGRIDFQTTKGKTAAGVLRHASRFNIPTIAIGGSVEMCPELTGMGFAGIYSIINTPMSLEKAMQKDIATTNISRTIEQVMKTIKYHSS